MSQSGIVLFYRIHISGRHCGYEAEPHPTPTMILTWTSEFITTALSTLTEEERAAIHLTTDLSGAARPGPARLKKFGFGSVHEYCTALETARPKLKNWFAVWGIHKLGDLDFVEPGRSAEGRIQKMAEVGKRTQK
jgi:hypothetical protein